MDGREEGGRCTMSHEQAGCHISTPSTNRDEQNEFEQANEQPRKNIKAGLSMWVPTCSENMRAPLARCRPPPELLQICPPDTCKINIKENAFACSCSLSQ